MGSERTGTMAERQARAAGTLSSAHRGGARRGRYRTIRSRPRKSTPRRAGKRAALVLIAGVEFLPFGAERIRDIDRPSRKKRAVLQRQRKNEGLSR